MRRLEAHAQPWYSYFRTIVRRVNIWECHPVMKVNPYIMYDRNCEHVGIRVSCMAGLPSGCGVIFNAQGSASIVHLRMQLNRWNMSELRSG